MSSEDIEISEEEEEQKQYESDIKMIKIYQNIFKKFT